MSFFSFLDPPRKQSVPRTTNLDSAGCLQTPHSFEVGADMMVSLLSYSCCRREGRVHTVVGVFIRCSQRVSVGIFGPCQVFASKAANSTVGGPALTCTPSVKKFPERLQNQGDSLGLCGTVIYFRALMLRLDKFPFSSD
eukprot:g5176.t1